MSFQITPRVGQDPVRSQTGGLNGRVEPVRDASPGALLSIGSGLQQLGRATTDAAAVYQGEVDKAQSLRMRNLLGEDFKTELHDPEKGFLTTIGMDASADRRKQAFDRLKARRKSIEAMAQNDTQRLNFSVYADRIEAEANTRASVHQEREVRNFRAGETKTAVGLGIQRAIQFVGTDEGAIALAESMRDIDTLADLYGWPKDSKQREAMKRDAKDALHSGVIDQYTQDPMGAPIAAIYLAEHRGEMSPKVLRKSVEDVRRAVDAVQRATTDKQSFDAARWAIQQPGTLIDQIEALNKFHEGDPSAFPIESRDKAEARLRSMERSAYEDGARRGNDALSDAQDFAAQNRVRVYEELPLETRTALEDTGRDVAVKTWLSQGKQNVTVKEGIDLILSASDEMLASVSRDTLQASAAMVLSTSDTKALLNEWDRVHGQQEAAATAARKDANTLPDGLINMTVTRIMQQRGYLPTDRNTTPDESNRRDWVLERVKRDLRANGGKDTADAVINRTLGATLTVRSNEGMTGLFSTVTTVPESFFTAEERDQAFYQTPVGEVPLRQVGENEVAARIAENMRRNDAIRDFNETQPERLRVPLLPEVAPPIVSEMAVEAESRRVQREKALQSAQQWLEGANRSGQGDVWHRLPDDIRKQLNAAGVAELARTQWEEWNRTHNFLGRRITPDGPMQQSFGSPWGR